jgi:NitT/TauT family transport system permease protein
VPIVVFVPILATMIGYTTTMVVTLVALMSFFPSFVMVSSGLSSLPAAAQDVSAVYGASKWRKLIHIALPASLPNLFASIRLSASRAILATMVAEFLTGIDGLGTLFLLARADLQSEIALGAALIGAAVAVVMYYIADMLEAVVNRRLT